MPIYDYLCSNCAGRTEVIHGISDPGPRFCPACGAEGTLRKAFAPPAVHFKGSGWAKKDRSSSSAKAPAKSEAGSEPGAAKSTGSATSGDSSSAGSTAAKPGSSASSGSSSSSDASAG